VSRKMNFRVWRGDKSDGGLKEVQVEVNEGEVVLDVIHRIQATQMGDLAVRWNCIQNLANSECNRWMSNAVKSSVSASSATCARTSAT
jgi:succinate dehydrogenase/fumarate reductase-like Fe-S protein